MLAVLPGAFLVGLALGYVYFRALRQTANMIVAQGVIRSFALALTLGRVALLGARPLWRGADGRAAVLAVLAGVLCAKAVMIRQAREAGT